MEDKQYRIDVLPPSRGSHRTHAIKPNLKNIYQKLNVSNRREAVDIIREGKGSHFDPDMVDAFLQVEEKFREIALEFADHEEEREALLT